VIWETEKKIKKIEIFTCFVSSQHALALNLHFRKRINELNLQSYNAYEEIKPCFREIINAYEEIKPCFYEMVNA